VEVYKTNVEVPLNCVKLSALGFLWCSLPALKQSSRWCCLSQSILTC